jgi:nicotinamide mononucleotide transporter
MQAGPLAWLEGFASEHAWAFAPWVYLGSYGLSALELVAVLLALGCVVFNVLENSWGWPLAIVSSLLYGVFFAHHGLFGDASVQVYFAVLSLWAWWQWLFGKRDSGLLIRPAFASPAVRIGSVLAWLALWPAMAWVLMHYTPSEWPWFDAALTAGSVIGQILLGRKLMENWLIWMAVNIGSVILFGIKGLWLTCGLYGVFLVLAVLGWKRWRASV